MSPLGNLIQSLKDHKRKVSGTIEEKVNELGGALGSLNLEGAPSTHTPAGVQSNPQFPGGFRPGYSTSSSGHSHSNSHSSNSGRPAAQNGGQSPSFPVPTQYSHIPSSSSTPPPVPPKQQTSKTLEYALASIHAVPYPAPQIPVVVPLDGLRPYHPPARPYSDPEVPRYQDAHPPVASTSNLPPSTPKRPTHQAPTPASVPSKSSSTKTNDDPPSPSRGRRRNSSTSSLPAKLPSKNGAVQCSGVTKSGSQCKNMVKDSAALGVLDPEEGETMKRFCHIHTDQIKKSAAYLSNNVAAPFETFIPEYLNAQTQVQLKTAMLEKVTDADKAGYIYIYEVQDPNRMHADIVEFKVGRSYKPIQRVGQWENSCRSQNHIVRYIFPPPPNQIMLAGMMRQGDPAKFCHRLERLIHLELADLSLHGPYLHEADKDSVLQLAAKPRTHCVDCKKLHQEIFSFRKAKRGKNQDKEYEMVQEVVDRWGLFVNEFLSRTD